MREPTESAFRWRHTREQIERDPSLANPFGERPSADLPEIDRRQWRIGTAAWFTAIGLGLLGGAIYGPVGLALFAITLIVPGVIVRTRFRWTHYEIGVAIGIGITLAVLLFIALALLMLGLLAYLASA